jgi:hypothetical protein
MSSSIIYLADIIIFTIEYESLPPSSKEILKSSTRSAQLSGHRAWPHGLARQFVEIELQIAITSLRVQPLSVRRIVRIEMMLQLPGIGIPSPSLSAASLPVHRGGKPTHLALVGDQLAS